MSGSARGPGACGGSGHCCAASWCSRWWWPPGPSATWSTCRGGATPCSARAGGVRRGGAAVALRVHRWEVTETAVHTQTGWWVRERRIAPMSRIQTVDHVEGALARLFGLASVTVNHRLRRGRPRDRRAGPCPRPRAGRRADPARRRRRGRRHVSPGGPGAPHPRPRPSPVGSNRRLRPCQYGVRYQTPTPGRDVSELARDEQWQRLDRRMMLVHPVRGADPLPAVLIGLSVAGTAAGGERGPGSCSASRCPWRSACCAT